MNKKNVFIVIFSIMILLITLSSCGKTKLSGTYVSEDDDTVSIEFSGESKVILHNGDNSICGHYLIADDVEMATIFLNEEINWSTFTNKSVKISEMILKIKDNNTLTLLTNMESFVKKGFWSKHWLKILIGFFIIGSIFTIAEAIYKKKTGRNLDEDIDNFIDKL